MHKILSKLARFSKKTRGIFWVLTSPDYWHQIYPYNEEWDRKLNELLDTEKFIRIDGYTAKLGEQQVWIANHPYASMRPYGNKTIKGRRTYGSQNIRPKRETIARAYRKLEEDN